MHGPGRRHRRRARKGRNAGHDRRHHADPPVDHGVFETGLREICEVVHAAGGQVYVDGANMNPGGLVRLPDVGADVCHPNLHKTFASRTVVAAPGRPVAVKEHLAPFLPGHPLVDAGPQDGPVSGCTRGAVPVC